MFESIILKGVVSQTVHPLIEIPTFILSVLLVLLPAPLDFPMGPEASARAARVARTEVVEPGSPG